jgi:hypothetical protein
MKKPLCWFRKNSQVRMTFDEGPDGTDELALCRLEDDGAPVRPEMTRELIAQQERTDRPTDRRKHNA